KTAPPRQEHPKASATERSGPNQTSGLIAKGEQGGRSARRSPTLDDRSHRTRSTRSTRRAEDPERGTARSRRTPVSRGDAEPRRVLVLRGFWRCGDFAA